jgi:hypothetical protein
MSSIYKGFKKYHKWLGVVLAFFFILFALSGIVLNHRATFSEVDISRGWLPKEYRYNNWNNAAVRGIVRLSNDSLLLYGNVGVWRTDINFNAFDDFNTGFPKGIDNRKIADLHVTANGDIFAATLFGLYRNINQKWQKVSLPINEERMVALEQRGDSLIVMSRSYLLLALKDDSFNHFEKIPLLAPKDEEKRVSLFKTIWFIHSGKIWGTTGKLIVDIGGIAMILLSLTGLFYFFAPKLLRKIKGRFKLRGRVKRLNRWSYKWHLNVGVFAAILLLVVTATGMFLRPPLLIPIASKTVKPIKGSVLDDSNFWSDNLRDIIYDSELKFFLLATNEGIYALSPCLRDAPVKFALQPPVSVMGINVFWKENGRYVVGSFSGLYRWNPFQHHLSNYLTGQQVKPHSTLSSPFGNLAVAGGARQDSSENIFFDYNNGAFTLSLENPLPAMPRALVDQSGMSLWNLALEVHTWRILNFALSSFYILVVPLAGLLGIVIVITGIWMWIIRYRNRRKLKGNESN